MDSSTPHATDGTMNPDPMLMILGSMRQHPHGNTPYAGNLGGSYEFVPESREHALEWMRANRPNERATLIEIKVLEILDPNEEAPETPPAWIAPHPAYCDEATDSGHSSANGLN